MGERDVFWDGKKKTRGNNKDISKDNNLRKYFGLIEEYFFINRVVDLFGLGESLLVILSR